MAKTRERRSAKVSSDKASTSSTMILKYLKEYFADRKDLDTFEACVNEQMEAYEEIEKRRREEIMVKAEKVDEDGFVTVVSNKKVKIFEGEPEVDEIIPEKIERFKPLPNFYRNGGRTANERKNQQIEDLRRHFEQDKKKLQELKASRLFQPL